MLTRWKRLRYTFSCKFVLESECALTSVARMVHEYAYMRFI